MDATPKESEIIKTIKHPLSFPVKKIELTLTYYVNAYKVTSIKNSTWYRPGMWLSSDVVQQICETPGWDVTIIDNQILQTLWNLGTKFIP
jgi:hypothetical protein